MIICPYCLNKHAFTKSKTDCPSCHRDVPQDYIEAARQSPPVFIVTVGMSQHGKSTLLDSITTIIENLGVISPSTYHSYFDDYTLEKIQVIREEVQHHRVPDMTKLKTSPEPLLIGIHNFLNQPIRTLVIYDLAGEVLNNPQAIQEYVRPIMHAQTIWFLVSLPDLEANPRSSISDLIQLYLTAMQRLKAPIHNRNVLIIYTKGDEMIKHYGERLSQEIKEYLILDPYLNMGNLDGDDDDAPPDFYIDEYLAKMYEASDLLKKFTINRVNQGRALVNKIEANKLKLHFTITSATGANVDKTQQTVAFTRYRVLDPLLHSLVIQGGVQAGDKQYILVVDGQSDFFTLKGRLGEIYDELAIHGLSVNTYVLGKPKPIAEGMRPEALPKRPPISLLGVVIDNLPKSATPANTGILLLTEKHTYDLYDYMYGAWYERIFIVHTGIAGLVWHHQLELDGFEFDARNIVEAFTQHMTASETE